MKRSMSGLLAVFLLAMLLLIATVSAVSITESPDVVQRGDTVTLAISDLPDGASFSLLIGGKFGVTPGQRFSFETRNFNMPFALNQGTVSATTQGTQVHHVRCRQGRCTGAGEQCCGCKRVFYHIQGL